MTGTARLVVFLALRHLGARRRQTVVATLAMAIGVAVLIGMTSLMTGFQDRFLEETVRISPHVTITDEEAEVGRPASRVRLDAIAVDAPAGALVGTRRERPPDRPARIRDPAGVARAARALPGVVAVAPALIAQTLVAFGGRDVPVEVRGVLPAEQERVTAVAAYVIAGRYEDLAAEPESILLGSGVAEDLGVRVDDRVVVAVPGRAPRSLKVVAIAETGIPIVDRTRAFVPLRTAQALAGRPEEVNTIGVRLDDPGRAEAVAARLTAATGHRAESWQEANANWLGLFAVQIWVTRIIVGAIVVVAAFGILNILVMIVLEKRRDIAILRSIGLTRRDVQRVFLVEGAAIGLAGGALGCVLGWLIVAQLRRVDIRVEGMVSAEGFVMSTSPGLWIAGAAFALAAALAASVLPARRAARTEPVEVIRGQT